MGSQGALAATQAPDGGPPPASSGGDVSRGRRDPSFLPRPEPLPRERLAVESRGPVIGSPMFGMAPGAPHRPQRASPRPRQGSSYPGGPPRIPLPRPKPTCSGIVEALQQTQAEAYVHWGEGEGLHLHVGAASAAGELEGEGVLKQHDGPHGDQWSTAGCCRGGPSAAGGQGSHKQQHCIPVFKHSPKLCPKSESIIRVYRKQRLRQLWGKLDVAGEGVADLFALRPVVSSLDLQERLFLNAVIPLLVQRAVSKTSQDAATEGLLSLGPKYDQLLRLSPQKPDVEGPVRIATLPAASRPPRFRQEQGEVKETAEEQRQQQEQQEQRAAALYKRLAREQAAVVMLDGDQETANASATPRLFVSERVFISTCLSLLSDAFGVEGVDQFRDTISYSCRKLVAAVNPAATKQICKPHVLAFSRKLERQRQQQQEQQQQEQQQQEQQQRQRSRSVPPCGDPGCCLEARHQLQTRRWTRFDGVIARYLRRKQQQQHVSKALEDLREGQHCTFHPEINPTPRYLRRDGGGGPAAKGVRGGAPTALLERSSRRARQQQKKLMPTDPMLILQQFCSRYVEDTRCSELIKALEECSFQPNAHKFVKQERERQEQQQRKAGARGKQQPAAECCGDEEGATAAAVDRIFKMLDSPFDAVFQADIRQWLQQQDEEETAAAEGDSGAKAKLLRQAKLAAAAPKKWVLDGREPQHRDRRSCVRISECLVDEKGQPVLTIETPAAASAHVSPTAAAAQTRSAGGAPSTPRSIPVSLRITNPSQRWKESLRGGYLLPSMNFSLEAEGDAEKQLRRQAIKKEDWSKCIRVCERGLETRAIPSDKSLKQICDDFTMPQAKPPPTLWEHRRQRRPCLERGPDARTYTAAAAGRAAFASSLSLARCCQQQAAVPTVFAVPTPAKPLALQDSYQLCSQLAKEVETGAFKPPPKIVGVRRDQVSYLEQQLAKMKTPLIVCTDTSN
ncbi:hypothetical protein Efla_002413 [Eimeria flavescens]